MTRERMNDEVLADLGADRDDGRVRDPLDPRGGLPLVAGRRDERPAGPDHEGRRRRPAAAAERGHPRDRALLRARHRGPRGASRRRRGRRRRTRAPRPRAGRWPRARSGEHRPSAGDPVAPAAPDAVGHAPAACRAARSATTCPPSLVVRRRASCSGSCSSRALELKAFILPAALGDRRRPASRTGTAPRFALRPSATGDAHRGGRRPRHRHDRRRRGRVLVTPAGSTARGALLPLAVAAERDPDHRVRAADEQLVRACSARCRR